MSYILDALKRAEQTAWRRKELKSPADEPAFGSPAWKVKMVSPVRYTRLRLEEETSEEKEAGHTRGVTIAAVVLLLLLLVECAVIYEVRGRTSDIATEVTSLARQIRETEAQLTRREGERVNLKKENDSLRQELEAASADLSRVRMSVQELKVKERRLTAKKRQARAVEQEKPAALRASGPPPANLRQPGTERPPELDVADTVSVTSYSIR